MDEALVPSTQRLRIRRSNFRLLYDTQSKESTLQLVYDVLRRCHFFKAFLVTAYVPKIYMQEFWATENVHHHTIRFKMDNKKHIVNLESFRDMLHICPRIPGQSFDELPFEEEILDFIRFLRHSATIRTLTDVNINKLYQPWRSFAAIINKCLTGKSSGYDSLRLSQAQILWGLYHKRNVDYAFLIWEDFVYQVEHKNHKKSNEMYYHRFTKVIIHHFMSKDPSIQRRNKFGALLPIELTNEEIRNFKAYKEYYAIATGEAAPKPKASARRTRSGFYTSITPPTAAVTPRPTVTDTPRLTATAKGKQPAKAPKAKSLSALSEPDGSGTDEGIGADDQGKDEDDDEEDERDDHEEGKEDDDEDKDGDERDGDDEEQEVTKDDEQDDTERSRDDDEEGLKTGEEERLNEEEEADELYRHVDINQGRDVKSIFVTASTSMAPLPTTAPTMTPSIVATITTTSQAPTPPTPIPSDVIQHLSSFGSLFRFNDRLKSLEANFSEFRQTNPVAEAVSAIPGIVHQYMNKQMNEASVNAQLEAEVLTRSSHSSRTSYVVVADLSEMELKKILIEKMEGNKSIQRSNEQRNLYKALVEAYEADKIIVDIYRETVILKRRRDNDDDDDDKDEGPFAGSDRGSKRRREGKEPESDSAPSETTTRSAGRSTTGSRSRQALTSKSTFAKEPVQTTSQMDEPSHLVFDTGVEDQPIVQSSQHPECELVKQADSRSSLNELMDTPLDFSNFIMNRLRVDILTHELLAGPTYELMMGSCKILIELEYHLEEVYKATTDQLDWVNPKGQQYPYNLLQPLPLIPDNRGRRVIPFSHFINNDLEYLRGGTSSHKYTTSVTKTKAADYGHIKWIKVLVPRTMWIQEPIDYDKHALWGRRIITVTDLKIVEWHSYKHLDWITVRRDDDKLYKFKEGNFKRLRLQDIKDMLLLLVQGKLSNVTIEERFAFKVSLRMFTRSIRKEAYTAYSNPRGFIYQNKDKKNRLMRINKLHKFSDGTLIDVRTALDDRLKRIRMRYLPQTIWRKSDKDRAAAMIQAIDKMLKTRRIMRSLERFVGGRLYEGDFWMLQRTI
uniref:Monodehydroascorbate reductase n=1 Tax=Tanacetum cinerariifolium TaxID=118510 RepID=A0A6L2LKK1_TANCI|nr:hypothetical protein [Tanacetum cinerariifolium]